MRLYATMAAAIDCPLDLSSSNFTLAASLCSNQDDRGKCCRYINAVIAVSVSQYANSTSNLVVTSNLSEICLRDTSKTFQIYGVTRNAIVTRGFGTKIPVNYDCHGLSNVSQMQQTSKFSDVMENCKVPLSEDNTCRKCLNAGIIYLRNVLGQVDNVTLSTCRDASLIALASQLNHMSTIDVASCLYGIQGLLTPPGSAATLLPPQASPTPPIAASPTQLSLITPLKEKVRPYHITLVPAIGIAVRILAVAMLVVFVILIRKKKEELESTNMNDKTFPKAIHPSSRKFQDGPPCMLRQFSFKETEKATNNFSIIIGQGDLELCTKLSFQVD